MDNCKGCGTPLDLNAHQPGCPNMDLELQIKIMMQPQPSGYGFTRNQALAYIAGDYDPSDPTHAEYLKESKQGWEAYLRRKRKPRKDAQKERTNT